MPDVHAGIVELRFAAQRVRQPLQRLLQRGAVELAEPGVTPCLRQQLDRIEQVGGTHAGTCTKCLAACQAKVMAGPSVEPGPG